MNNQYHQASRKPTTQVIDRSYGISEVEAKASGTVQQQWPTGHVDEEGLVIRSETVLVKKTRFGNRFRHYDWVVPHGRF